MISLEKPKILVVDDEEIIRIGCQRILEDSPSQVDLAENGRVGLEKVKAAGYDLVLLDLMMPEMGGMELLDEIQKLDPKIVCIVITGFATIETAVDAVKKGAYDYLPKPFTPDEFRAKVHRGLEKRCLILEAEKLREERDRNLLECSNEKTRTLTIVNCMSEGLIATNRMGQIVLINPAALKMLRLKESRVIGQTVHGLLGNPDLEKNIAETLERVTKTSKLTRLEISTPDGRFLQPNITAIIDESGECLGTVTVLIDITEEKKVEKMKSHFMRLVSHELKAPIGAIEGYLNLIIDGLTANNPEKEKEIIKRSRDKAESLIELINDLLDLSRTEQKAASKVMAPVILSEVLNETINFYQNEAKAKMVSVQMTLPSDMPKILGNSEDLSRLFANLVSNAIKYTPEKGSVTICAERRNAHVAVSVQDTGIGMSKEDLAKIFEEFYRAKNAISKKISGTGLGLAIAKKIAEEHQGYIEVESELNKGSVFRVVLPVLEEKVQ
jgi:two-component system phosphate regulon sensor histidine kinase PhoR